MTYGMRTIAYIKTPVKVGDLVSMLNAESAWGMELTINSDGVLEVQS
jgi:hypothetical protein